MPDILPESSNGFVLVTSRSREAAYELVGDDDNIIKTERMNKDEALTLFRQRLGDDSIDADTLELLQYLDYMPLAISQAAAYIRQKRPRMTVLKYLHDVQKNATDKYSLLKVAIKDRRRDGKASNSILATWQISFEYIRAEQLSAANLLSLMSFFDRQGIPDELLTGYDEDGGTGSFDEDIEMLRSFSLVMMGVDGAVFEMHRLVQFATRKWLEERTELEKWKERYISIMADAFPPGNYENWAICRPLFPHAELVLAYQPVDESFLQRWTTILINAGRYAQEQGHYDKSEVMNRRALEESEKILGKEHSSTLPSINNLALALQYQGKYEEVEAIHRRALAGYEKVLGKEHPHTLTSVSNLALVLRYQGKYEEAEAMHRRVLAGYEKVLGKEHPDTLTSVSNLVLVLQYQGKYEEVEAMQRRALDGREKVLGEEHPHTLASVNNLAMVLQYQGKYEEAEAMYRRALAGYEKVLGKEHPHTLTSIYNLANLLHQQQRFVLAKSMYKRALAGFERVLRPDHPITKACISHYSSLLRDIEGKTITN